MASNFNFDAFNAATKGANTGLTLWLGMQLLKNVLQSLDYFDNPLADNLRPILNDLKAFRVSYKAEAEARAEKKGLMASDGKSE